MLGFGAAYIRNLTVNYEQVTQLTYASSRREDLSLSGLICGMYELQNLKAVFAISLRQWRKSG